MKELRHDLSQAKYLVSFISLLSENTSGYDRAAKQMMDAVTSQEGFVAAYSARNEDGVGITNSYWTNLEAISQWKSEKAHQAIQAKGKTTWYSWYQLQVTQILRSY
jgi:heme-degrading monooxygenase HmoA